MRFRIQQSASVATTGQQAFPRSVGGEQGKFRNAVPFGSFLGLQVLACKLLAMKLGIETALQGSSAIAIVRDIWSCKKEKDRTT